jgi:hypothetical protein
LRAGYRAPRPGFKGGASSPSLIQARRVRGSPPCGGSVPRASVPRHRDRTWQEYGPLNATWKDVVFGRCPASWPGAAAARWHGSESRGWSAPNVPMSTGQPARACAVDPCRPRAAGPRRGARSRSPPVDPLRSPPDLGGRAGGRARRPAGPQQGRDPDSPAGRRSDRLDLRADVGRHRAPAAAHPPRPGTARLRHPRTPSRRREDDGGRHPHRVPARMASPAGRPHADRGEGRRATRISRPFPGLRRPEEGAGTATRADSGRPNRSRGMRGNPARCRRPIAPPPRRSRSDAPLRRRRRLRSRPAPRRPSGRRQGRVRGCGRTVTGLAPGSPRPAGQRRGPEPVRAIARHRIQGRGASIPHGAGRGGRACREDGAAAARVAPGRGGPMRA